MNSVISNCQIDEPAQKSNRGWRGVRVQGILDLNLVGILNDILQPLKEHGIAVFVVSTFDTDYIFIKQANFETALRILKSTENILLEDSAL